MKTELSQSERELLTWMQKTIRASKYFNPDESLSFSRFMEAGGKRFEWPGWEIICGPKPGKKEQKKLTIHIEERRKSA